MELTITRVLAASLLTTVVAAQQLVPPAVVAAVGKARKDNQRVLLVCGDSEVQAQIAGKLRRLILYEYVRVDLPAHVGAEGAAYGQQLRPDDTTGPFVAILDGHYAKVASRNSASLSDVATTETWLKQHQAEPQSADEVYAAALALAQRTNRRVLVHLGAPW